MSPKDPEPPAKEPAQRSEPPAPPHDPGQRHAEGTRPDPITED